MENKILIIKELDELGRFPKQFSMRTLSEARKDFVKYLSKKYKISKLEIEKELKTIKEIVWNDADCCFSLRTTSNEIQKEEYIRILRDPNLFNIVAEEFSKKIVGENDNIKAIFLNCCGIFVENHQTASYSLCVNSESGAGKDYIATNILKLFPKEFVESRTRISPTAFTYWHNSKFEPEWDWNGKICYLQDISDEILNCEVFKTMVSEGSYATVVKDQRALDIEIKGKPVIIITTATANPKNEMLRRFPILTLDESINQTKAIMKRQSEMAKIGANPHFEYSEDITNALRYLKGIKVKIPFTDVIVNAYPSEHIIMRTHFQRLLDLIKCSTALHQYQREIDTDGYVIADPKDYDIAITALRQTTQNALMIPLTKKQQKLLELCKKEYKDEWFSAPEIAGKCSFLSQSNIYIYLDKLQELFFDTDSFVEDPEKSKRPIKKYHLKSIISINIPTYEECCKIRIEGSEGNEGIIGIEGIDNSTTTTDENNSYIPTIIGSRSA